MAESSKGGISAATVLELRKWLVGEPSGSHSAKAVSAFVKALDNGTLKPRIVQRNSLTGMPVPDGWKEGSENDSSFLLHNGKKACPNVVLWGIVPSNGNLNVQYHINWDAQNCENICIPLKKLLDEDASDAVELLEQRQCREWPDKDACAASINEYLLDSLLLHLAEALSCKEER